MNNIFRRFENTPLANLWLGFKFFTCVFAFVLSIVMAGLSLLYLFADQPVAGVITAIFAVVLTFFEKRLKHSIQEEAGKEEDDDIDWPDSPISAA